MDADALANKIDQAQSIEHLDALEQDSLQIEGVSRRLLGLTIGSKRRELIAIQRQKGAYLVDAQTIFYLDKPDGKDPKPEEAFDLIRRKETPPFYQKLVDDAAAAFKNGHKPNLKQMVEGATGPIIEGDSNPNLVRLLRALGSKNQPNAGLRTHKKNFLSFPTDHKRYYDTHPQVALVPILPVDRIVNHDGETVYDCAVLVMSATEAQEKGEIVEEVEDVYQKLMKNFDWAGFPETPGKDTPGLCSKDELQLVFSVLGFWIAANAYSLHVGEPQALIDLTCRYDTMKSGTGSFASGGSNSSKGSNGGNKKTLSPKPSGGEDEKSESVSQEASEEGSNSSIMNKWEHKKKELDLAKQRIFDNGLELPKLKNFKDEPLPKVLKVAVRVGANDVPDPWVLTEKATVNVTYCAYGIKALPVCVSDPDTSSEQNGESLSVDSQGGIDFPPVELIIPSTASDHVATTPHAGASGRKTTSRVCEEKWESLSEASTVVSESPAVVTPSQAEDRGKFFEQEKWENLSNSSN